MENVVRDAAEVLKKGGVILYPTDTVWGIGCDATNDDAVRRIYEIKKSVDKKGMIVLCGDIDMVWKYVSKLSPIAEQLFELADKPLTLILPGAGGVSNALIPEEGTLAVRIPKTKFMESLFRRFPKAVVSTSANISGQPTPTSFGDISEEIKSAVDFIVDPKVEGRVSCIPSSIISLGENGEIKIIRE